MVVPGLSKVLADQRVHERRLAHVGPADDGHARPAVALVEFLLVILGEFFQHRVDELADALAVRGRDRYRETEAQLLEIRRGRIRLHALGLVDGDPHPRPQFAQLLGDAPVVGRQSRAGIGEEDHRVGFGDCLLGLLRHLREDALGGAGLKPPGIDHVVRAAAKQAFAIVAVARHAGHVHDDRIARAGEAVEEGALADVGPAY